jgi:hypothetical protein
MSVRFLTLCVVTVLFGALTVAALLDVGYWGLLKASRTVEARAQRSVAELGLCLSDFGVMEALLHKGPGK